MEAADIAAMFGDSFNTATASGAYEYITPGEYWVKILAIKPIKAKRTGGNSGVAVEMEVLKTVREVDGVSAVPGQKVSDFMSQTGNTAVFFDSNVKALMSKLLVCKDTDISKENMVELLMDDSDLRGRVVQVNCFKKDPEKAYVAKDWGDLISHEQLTAAGLA
jgi:hypothetical protein